MMLLRNKTLLLITALSSLLMLSALYSGWLHPFFFGSEHASVQGIDFFAVPKSYLNLLEGRSAFDTWGGSSYGPYATWYLAHPAFSVFIASWFSFFEPWTAYWLFAIFSILLMVISASFIASRSGDKSIQRNTFLVVLCSFPTFWLYYTGNMHAPLVLALSLLFCGMLDLSENESSGKKLLLAGLLLSFFSKPIVLLMMPLLLLLKETRRTAFISLLIYGSVSILFLIIPALNPQGIGIDKLMQIAGDPEFIKEHMNIYKNQFVLNEFMKDNSIHWLNLIAQSDYKLLHIDVFSLPVFMDTLLGKETPAALYKLPIYLSLLFSLLVPLLPNKKSRLDAALLLLMTISLTFFLSYNTVWEYQFSSALPLVALLPILRERNAFDPKVLRFLWYIGLLFCLPSLYVLVRGADFNSAASLSLIRLDRVLPALVLFLAFLFLLYGKIRRELDFGQFAKWWKTPGSLFFD